MTEILAPLPVQQFTDNYGNPLVGGKLFTYAAGTTTKQVAYTDSSGVTALPNPVILNGRGEISPSATGNSCGLWFDPTLSYRIVLSPSTDTDPPTNPIWAVDQVVSPQAAILAALATYQAALTGVPVGGMIAFGGTAAPSGWLLCYGQAVSRTTYAALFATIGIAYGGGDGSTTFNVPDRRGRVSVGTDNMGGVAAGRVTAAVCGTDATILGNSGGDQNAQQDTITATSTATSTDSGHQHSISPPAGVGVAAGGYGSWSGASTQTETTAVGQANITTTVNTSATSSLTGQAQNMPPFGVDNWIIYAGA